MVNTILNNMAQGYTFEELQKMKSQTSSDGLTYERLLQMQKDQQPSQSKRSIGGFIGNAAGSFADAISGIVGGAAQIVAHPFDTGRALLSRKGLQAIKEYATSRYGSVGKIGETLYKDPFGVALDAATVLDVGAGGTKVAGKLIGSPALSSASGVMRTAEEAVNPATRGTRMLATGTEKLVSKVEAPFESSYLPKTEAKFKEAGITTPPLSAISKSPVVRTAESLAAKGFFGEKVGAAIQNTRDFLLKKADELVKGITPETLSKEGLGKVIKEGAAEYEKNFRSTQKKIYESYMEKSGKLPATTENTQKALSGIIDDQSRDLFGKPEAQYSALKDKLSGRVGMPGSVGFTAEGKFNTPYTFEDLKATRTSVGHELSRDPRNPYLNRLYKALGEDMSATVTAKDAELGKELTKINEDYKNGIQQVESKLTQSILKSSPENLAKNLLAKDSADTFKALRKVIGEDRYAELSKSVISKILSNATTRGEFDILKLEKNLSKYDQATLDELFSKEQKATLKLAIEELKTNRELVDTLKPGAKVREGSQTAYIAKQFGMTTVGLYALGELLRGNPIPILIAGSELIADYGGSKLMTTGAGRKWLTSGFDVAMPVGERIRSLAPSIGRGSVRARAIGGVGETGNQETQGITPLSPEK